jgi:hypothetical protein
MLLEGLSDADLLIPPVPEANHVNWMLGHLVVSENQMAGWLRPQAMAPLPQGLAEKYDPKRAQVEASDWLSKDELLRLAREQRAGTLRVLDAMTDAELGARGPR